MVVEDEEEDDLSSFVQNQKKVLNKTEVEIRQQSEERATHSTMQSARCSNCSSRL
jgi:hypothetical protein